MKRFTAEWRQGALKCVSGIALFCGSTVGDALAQSPAVETTKNKTVAATRVAQESVPIRVQVGDALSGPVDLDGGSRAAMPNATKTGAGASPSATLEAEQGGPSFRLSQLVTTKALTESDLPVTLGETEASPDGESSPAVAMEVAAREAVADAVEPAKGPVERLASPAVTVRVEETAATDVFDPLTLVQEAPQPAPAVVGQDKFVVPASTQQGSVESYPTMQTTGYAGVANAVMARQDDSPFKVIDQSGEMTVQVRRTKLLRTENSIYRSAVVDSTICEVVQFTPREVSVIGKGQGATHVTFWFEGEVDPVTYLVRVTPDTEEVKRREMEYRMLEDVINDLFPDSKVRLTQVADKLIVRGQAKDSEEATQIMTIIRDQTSGALGQNNNAVTLSNGNAANVLSEDATGRRQSSRIRVINMLEIPGVQQVALRVKIAELNRSAARGFGVDVDAAINVTAGTSTLFLQSLLNATTGNAPALLAQFDGDDISIGIRYLQQHGVLRLLSEPTLVTLSGRPATFVAGGEFAVPTVVGNVGLNAVTTDFRAFGVIISFVPTVVDKDRVRLEVAPEFSQINQDLTVNSTPGLNVRAVTTTVEMREGQTLAIAGLLEDTMTANSRGDLPFLSKVFGERDTTRNETELIILVTPELVHPMEPEEVPPLPGFDVTEPTGSEFFLHGKLEGDPTRDHRSTVWPRLRSRYRKGGPAMISGPFGHGQ